MYVIESSYGRLMMKGSWANKTVTCIENVFLGSMWSYKKIVTVLPVADH